MQLNFWEILGVCAGLMRMKRSRSNVPPSDTFRNLFHPRRAIRSAMRHLHRPRLRHWRVQKGLLPQAQILFRFPQCVLLVCFPVIRPFPHRPINRTPLRTGTIQPHSFSVPQVASWLQVVSKLHQPLCHSGRFFLPYLTRFLSLYLFPLFFRLPLFFSTPPYPPYSFPTPPYGQGSTLSPPIPPILYILYIYYYSLSYLQVQRYYSSLSPSYPIWFCFVVGMRIE